MHDSVKFVLAALAAGALATPPSLFIQKLENDGEAKVLAEAATGGRPDPGKQAILRHGCNGCHNIPGVSGAVGQVGPKLAYMTQRAELAARLPNDVPDLMAWIRHPQQISPGSGMPEMNLPEQDVRDIAAYLYTVRGS